MMNHLIRITALLIALQFLSGHQVNCDVFYIVPSSSADISCPGRITGEPCITLQQYINGEFTQYFSNPDHLSDITLEFQPGKHPIYLHASYYSSASGFLSVSDLISFTMRSKSNNSTLTEITCTSSDNNEYHPHIRISSVQSVSISGITFKGCKTNIYSATSLYSTTLIVKDSAFYGRTVPLYYSYREVSYFDIGNSLATVKRCTFTNCTVGLRGDTSSVTTIDHCSFINNEEAVELRHTPVHRYAPNMTIDQCSFINNGRAVQILNGSMQILTIRNSSFVDNKVKDGSGGAILMTGNHSSLAVHHCHFMNNSAEHNGGAISFKGHSIILEKSTFNNNTARDGGVISVRNASVLIVNSTFSHNKANSTAGVLFVDDSRLIINGASFDNNTAGTSGGVISTKFVHVSLSISQTSLTNNWAGRSGGVMYIGRAGSQVKISKSTIGFNSATNRGGVIELLGSSLQINSTTIFNNTANHGDVIGTCTSNISVSEKLVTTVDPDYPVCTLFNGDINETASDDELEDSITSS